MDFEDIGRVWREERTGEIRRTRIEDLSASHKKAAKHLDMQSRIGLLASGFVILVGFPLFARAVMVSPHPLLAGTGALLLATWIIYVVIFWGRMGRSKPGRTLPVRDALAVELDRLMKMERFREGIRFTSWRFWAFVIGEILFVAGLMRDISASADRLVIWGIVVLCIAWAAVRSNRKMLDETVRPLRVDVESWLADLEKLDEQTAR